MDLEKGHLSTITTEKNYDKELDNLKKEVQELKKMFKEFMQCNTTEKEKQEQIHEFVENAKEEKIREISEEKTKPHIAEVQKDLREQVRIKNLLGAVSYFGMFDTGERGSYWGTSNTSVDDLLCLIENKMAEKVLQCIGNNDRLNILLAILKQPMSVANIVEKCGYNSTGQVYHHLNSLIATDIVTEDKNIKGVYIVQPHRVQGIIMILAGISDLSDNKYSQGNWE